MAVAGLYFPQIGGKINSMLADVGNENRYLICPKSIRGFGKCMGVCRGHSHHRCMGDDWTDVPLFQHVATDHHTGTTIVTFLMVFLIQNTQNRDAKAVHLKLGEIIRALKKARNEPVDLEELSDEELGRLEDQFRRLRTKAENQGTNMRHVEPEALESDR